MHEDELIRRVEKAIDERALFADGERIVAAVSGGADSIALLHMLCSLRERRGYRVAVSHINHGLRGAESDADEAYVRELAAQLGAPCFAARVDVEGALPKYGNNVQAAARALRLEAFREAAAAWDAGAAALAHHADDQAETVLMRLLRGTGAGGLGGIRFVSVVDGLKLVRPLLRITKSELEAYCERCGLSPRFDSSNASRKYFRNAVRMDLLPYIMKLREGAAEALRRTAELSADEDELLEELARQRVREVTRRAGEAIRADRKQFLTSHIALQRRMIKIILSSLNLNESAIDFMKIESIREAAAQELPTTLELAVGARTVFRRSYDTLEWAPADAVPAEPYRVEIDVSRPGSLELPGIDGTLEWSRVPKESFDPALGGGDAYFARFDAEAAEGPWTVRSRRPGDRIAPFGLNGTKTVKDIFVDGKLPKRLRDVWPIVADREGDLLWVPGFRRAQTAPVTDRTSEILTLRLRLRGNIF